MRVHSVVVCSTSGGGERKGQESIAHHLAFSLKETLSGGAMDFLFT